MKMMICHAVIIRSRSLLSSVRRDKVGVSLVLSSPSQSLNLGHDVGPPIVAFEHAEQTHHLNHALPALSTPHRPRVAAPEPVQLQLAASAGSSVFPATKNHSPPHLLFSEQDTELEKMSARLIAFCDLCVLCGK